VSVSTVRTVSTPHLSRPPLPRALTGALFLGLVLLALNLRSPLTTLPPVIDRVREDTGLGDSGAGMLTSVPVLCFGLLAWPASLLIRRIGIDRAVVVTLLGAAAGIVVRSVGGVPGLFIGMVVTGVFLTVGNTVALLVIGRDFAAHLGAVNGAYTASLNVGTMLTSALTAPLAGLWGWRGATGSWAALALTGALLWWAVAAWRSRVVAVTAATAPTAPTAPTVPERIPDAGDAGAAVTVGTVGTVPTRRRYVWLLAGVLTLHLFIYYALTTWLPSIMADRLGMGPESAGAAASTFQILALLGAFGSPVVARLIRQETLLVVLAVLWTVTAVGMLTAPALWPVWCVSGGIAQGGVFTVVFTLIVARSRNADDNRRTSTLVQGWAYTLSAVGPVLTGRLHELSGSWAAPLTLVSVLAAALVAVAVVLRTAGAVRTS
jgi:CP family cyanate transporter-like MFS transporter